MRIIIIIFMVFGASCAQLAPGQEANPSIKKFICTGTEPFWSLEVNAIEAELRQVTMTPEPERVKFKGSWVREDEAAGVYEWRGANEEDGTPFDVTITRAACYGTRDEPYEYQSSYGTGRPNGVFEPGCCELRVYPILD